MLYKKGQFKGKKVTIMGLGLLGRGVGDAAFLAREGAEIIVTDLKSKKELATSLTQLKKFKNITYHLGEHRLEDFENRDFILKAAGVPLDSPYIAHAKKHKVPVYMSTALFASLTPAKIVGITGTRGKTTVTHMIYEALASAQKGKKGKVYLGGNIQGVSTLAMLPKVKEADTVVLELDSWQLQGFGDMKMSPQVAVFTTFMPDHLNYYKGSLSAYFKDKAHIYKYQKEGDICIVGEQVKKIGKKYDLPKNITLAIPGEHNRYNAGLAYAALKAMKVPEKVIADSLKKFRGVSGRLEQLKSRRGITIYNDTTSTTPHALLTALEAVGKDKNIVLIAGGSDKNIDLKVLKAPLKKYCSSIILLPGDGTERLIKEKILPIDAPAIMVKNMQAAVKFALIQAKKVQIILLSPGFTSFGLFKNEYDRGDQFVTAVKKYR